MHVLLMQRTMVCVRFRPPQGKDCIEREHRGSNRAGSLTQTRQSLSRPSRRLCSRKTTAVERISAFLSPGNAAVLTGAGVSVDSGIRAYRGVNRERPVHEPELQAYSCMSSEYVCPFVCGLMAMRARGSIMKSCKRQFVQTAVLVRYSYAFHGSKLHFAAGCGRFWATRLCAVTSVVATFQPRKFRQRDRRTNVRCDACTLFTSERRKRSK
ncbi:hypothetical protein DFH11DRAFT_1295238 [Phellopilus nigrolimitatus]|nr:hypothetical protein DFH11DRAFT_1295238 [Phellopilus nigrolimitatus]